MAHDVFISHANTDKAAAEAVCRGLEDNGYSCWIAPRDVNSGGKSYPAQIINAIADSRAFVLVFSGAANDSDHVQREVSGASSERKPVITFRIERVPPQRDIKYFLGHQHWLDATTPPVEDHLDTLIEQIERTLGPHADGSAVPPPPPARVADGSIPDSGSWEPVPFVDANPPPARSTRNRGTLTLWAIIAVLLLVLTCLGGAVGYTIWAITRPGPEGISATYVMPDAVHEGDTFDFVITVRNEHPEERTLKDVDFWSPLLEGMTVIKVTPKYEFTNPGEPRTYSFNSTIPANGEIVVIFELHAHNAGTYAGNVVISVDSVFSTLSKHQDFSIAPALPAPDPIGEP